MVDDMCRLTAAALSVKLRDGVPRRARQSDYEGRFRSI